MNKEAQWLLRDKYNDMLETQFEADFNNDLLRLQNGEPLAYVIGWVPFLGAKIYLDSLPLIPRAETEYWVANAIDEIKEYAKKYGKENIKVLDLCAGSGCIGVAVLKSIEGAQVDFVEIDIAHHETIKKNILENGIDLNRTKIFGGNLFENVIGTYDFILTNPPYINPQYINDVQDGVLKNEPHLALFGGNDGMQIVREILQNAPNFLNENGVLYIEHEPHQATEIQTILPGIEPLLDQFGVARYSVFRK
ncbi:MAG: peptide chain release factor N(5)-glutamine methyltransferase [Candidatus Pacebacteria bacterium]|nr:peptide chain release factor N(5)-glutamine methyltransferase [Candidatus Paceibacterota bacterium]